MKIDLCGKVALVTGGSRGIGQAIANALHTAGAKVAVLARDGAGAEAAAKRLGDSARGYSCDVAQGDQVEAAVAGVERDLGPIDILVNNAGTLRDNLVFRIKDEDWDAVLDTNLKGAFLMIKHAARGMSKRRAGLIILTKSVAKELASRNVLVNAVAPGFIVTELTSDITPERRKAYETAIPLGRLGSGTDVASAVLFLASEFASYITGQVLVVDGGMVL